MLFYQRQKSSFKVELESILRCDSNQDSVHMPQLFQATFKAMRDLGGYQNDDGIDKLSNVHRHMIESCLNAAWRTTCTNAKSLTF